MTKRQIAVGMKMEAHNGRIGEVIEVTKFMCKIRWDKPLIHEDPVKEYVLNSANADINNGTWRVID